MGRLLLGIWLIVYGLQPWISISGHVPHGELLLPVLALAAGILILLGR